MKNFRQLVKELPSSTVVVTTGSFNPPTAQNELQFKLVEKLVEKHRAQHIIYIKEEGLPTARKTHFLNLMFSSFNYVPLKGSLNEEVAKLKTKYKNVIVVGDSVKGKLAESVQVIPFDETEEKIKGMVTKGDYTSFKAHMPSSMRDIDAKRLMNEMRQSYGLEFLKEDVKFSIDALRDKYFKGEIYQIGDIVESAGQEYEIMDRGSNYLVVVNSTGDLSRKWVKDVSLVENIKLIENIDICETANAGLAAKASKSGISLGTLQKVYRRGVAAWNSGHRPGTTPQQWGMARVNSYITKGKGTYHGADKDLREDLDENSLPRVAKDKASGLSKKYVAGLSASTAKARAAHWKKMDKKSDKDPSAYAPAPGDANAKTKPSKHTLKYHAMFGESMDEELLEACWTGYKQVGVKKKGNRQVPNCVPEEVKEAVDPKQFCYKGYTTKNFHHCADTAKTFELSSKDVKDPVGMLKAIKTTDTYLQLHGQLGENPTLDQIKTWKSAHIQAKDTLVKLGKFDAHQEAWLKHGESLNRMLEPHAAAIKESLTLDKHSNYNIAKSVMSYQDFMKLNKMNTGFIKDTKQPPFNQPIEPNVSQQIDDLQDWPFHPQTEVGHTLATRRHLRRQKVMYATESVQGDLMDEDFAAKFTTEANSGEVGDEIGNEKIAKVKTLPPQLAPKKSDAKRLGGGTRDHTFSAFMEKQKKENVDFDFDQLVKRRLAKE